MASQISIEEILDHRPKGAGGTPDKWYYQFRQSDGKTNWLSYDKIPQAAHLLMDYHRARPLEPRPRDLTHLIMAQSTHLVSHPIPSKTAMLSVQSTAMRPQVESLGTEALSADATEIDRLHSTIVQRYHLCLASMGWLHATTEVLHRAMPTLHAPTPWMRLPSLLALQTLNPYTTLQYAAETNLIHAQRMHEFAAFVMRGMAAWHREKRSVSIDAYMLSQRSLSRIGDREYSPGNISMLVAINHHDITAGLTPDEDVLPHPPSAHCSKHHTIFMMEREFAVHLEFDIETGSALIRDPAYYVDKDYSEAIAFGELLTQDRRSHFFGKRWNWSIKECPRQFHARNNILIALYSVDCCIYGEQPTEIVTEAGERQVLDSFRIWLLRIVLGMLEWWSTDRADDMGEEDIVDTTAQELDSSSEQDDVVAQVLPRTTFDTESGPASKSLPKKTSNERRKRGAKHREKNEIDSQPSTTAVSRSSAIAKKAPTPGKDQNAASGLEVGPDPDPNWRKPIHEIAHNLRRQKRIFGTQKKHEPERVFDARKAVTSAIEELDDHAGDDETLKAAQEHIKTALEKLRPEEEWWTWVSNIINELCLEECEIENWRDHLRLKRTGRRRAAKAS